MARTPLFKALRHSFQMARLANLRHEMPGDLIARHHAARISRRSFLEKCAGTAVVASTGGLLTGCLAPRRTRSVQGAPRVVIVGAGIAGLNAAYQLKRSGVRATVYEASARTGGRMFSSTGLLGPGLVTELGGEFIDSNHVDMLTLARQFRLRLLDMNHESEAQLQQEAYFFGGRHHTEHEIVTLFQPVAARLEQDIAALPDDIDYRSTGRAVQLDQTSLADYLDRTDVSGVVRQLLDVAYVTEYGLECAEQSALNLLFLIGTDTSSGSFDAFGESDERYKIVGGNQRICDELANRLTGQIELGRALVAIEPKDASVTLHFASAGQAEATAIAADIVILTVPFSVLRDVEWRGELPERKRRAIQELGYGANAKLFIGQTHRPWKESGYAGAVFSDEGFQLAWDNSRLQGTTAAGLTLYSGGRASWDVGNGSAEQQVDRLLPGVERAFPGVLTARHGTAHRFHWPTHPFTRAAYACYRPGQWTSIGGVEAEPVGNIFFAGEHCSREFQGFMNGGAETGRVAAAGVLRTAALA